MTLSYSQAREATTRTVHDRPDAGERPSPGRRHSWVMLTIVMPVHNEENTILDAVQAILAANIPCEFELLVINDGSTDATHSLIESLDDHRVRYVQQHCNLGKGAAVRAAVALATGTHLLVFDADLEYDASDIASVVTPVIEGRAEVVYGVRVSGMRTVFPSLTYALGNTFTTLAANLMYGSYMTDMHTCLKLVPVQLLRSMELREYGFGLDSEITGEILRRGYRPFEVPVSYSARSHTEGKKIRPSDGLRCLYVLAKVRKRGKMPMMPRLVLRPVLEALSVDTSQRVIGEELAG